MDETMSPSRSTVTAGFLLALGFLPAMSAGPVSAQDVVTQSGPMEIITDTPGYCLQLLDRVSNLVRLASAPVPQEITDLTTEGQRMCAKGQTRMGIMRLRSALMQMEKVDGTAYR